MKKKIWFLTLAAFLTYGGIATAQNLYPNALPGWFPTLHLGAATGGGVQCIHADNAGNLTGTGADCGGGGGSNNLGASVTTASPMITGDPTSGLYTPSAGVVAVAISGTEVASWASAGEHILANGAASKSPLLITGTILNGGSGTTNFPSVMVQPTGTTAVTTWNTGGTVLGVNTPSSYTGNVLDFHAAGGQTLFKVDNTGTITGNGYNAHGSPIAQSNALHSYGDSVTNCFLVTGTTCYPYYLSQVMNAVLTNNSNGGDMSCDMVVRVFDDEPTGPVLTYGAQNPVYTTMIGINDAELKGVGPYEVNYNNCLSSSLLWTSIASAYKSNGNSANCTAVGSWTAGTGSGGNLQVPQSMFSHTHGDTLSCTITTTGGPLYILYATADNWTGNFTYTVDGGAASSPVNSFPVTPVATHNGGVNAIVPITLNGIAAGSHVVLFTVNSATGASAFVEPVSVMTTPATPSWGGPMSYNLGVIKECGDANSAATAQYNADAQNDVQTLSNVGLLTYFSNVRNNLGSSQSVFADTCATPGLHPNALGHQLMTEGIAATMQPTSYSVGLGTVTSSAQYQMAYFASAGTTVQGNANIITDAGNDLTVAGVINQSGLTGANLTKYLHTNQALALSTTLLNPGLVLYDGGTQAAYGMDLGQDNSSRFGTRIFTAGGGSGGDIVFSNTNANPTQQSSFTDMVTIRGSNSRVGIGNGSPAVTLDVTGTIGQRGTAGVNLSQYMLTNEALTNSTTALNPGVQVYGGTTGSNYGVDLGYNNSRFRTRVFSGTGTDLALSSVTTGATPAAQTDFTEFLTVRGDTGRVGIGTTSPAALLDVAGPIKTLGYTVAALPSGSIGMRAYVTDQLASCVAAGAGLTGGGAVVCPVFYNGSAWVGD